MKQFFNVFFIPNFFPICPKPLQLTKPKITTIVVTTHPKGLPKEKKTT